MAFELEVGWLRGSNPLISDEYTTRKYSGIGRNR